MITTKGKFFLLFILCFSNLSLFAQWEACNDSLANLHITGMATFGNNIYLGTLGNTFYVSSDNGDSWTNKNNGITGNVTCISTNGNYLIVGTEVNGIFVSTDNGGNWTPKDSGLTNQSIISLTSVNGKVLASTYGGIFVSSDSCENWILKNNGLTKINSFYILNNGFYTYVGTAGSGVFRSSDYGDNWEQKNNGIDSDAFYIRTISVNGNMIYIGTEERGIFSSSDNGEQWIKCDLNNLWIYSIVFDGVNIFAGTENGVFISVDSCKTWRARNDGLANLSIYHLIATNSYIFAGTGNLGVYRAKMSDLTDVVENNREQNPISIFPNPAGNILTVLCDERDMGKELEIFNILGEKVYSSEINAVPFSTDISYLPQGTYILRTKTGTRIFVVGKY